MKSQRQLYTFKVSGNCYKARLFLHLLDLEFTPVEVDLPGGEHKRAPFLTLNPLGQIPVLVDDGVSIADSQAILVYLARRYAGERWMPLDPLSLAQTARWLSIAANDIQNGPATARVIELFGAKLNRERAVSRSVAIMAHMESHLARRHWLVGEDATIADIACYPYISLAPEGKLDMQPYPNLRAWMARVEALPGYVPMYPRSGAV